MSCRKSDCGGIQGSEFHLKAALLLLLRYMKEYGTNFELSAENPEGGSFDDLVIKFRDENGNERYILIQLKHKKNEAQTITYYDLLQQPKGDFNLLKYLESFVKINKSAGSEEKIQDMIIFTNLNLSKEILKKYVEEKASTDRLLSFASSAEFVKKPKLYKLNQTFIDELQHFKLRKLAEKILQCGFKKCPLKEDDNMLKDYHEVLAADVFNVADNKFKDDFLNDSNTLQETTTIFRNIIEQVFIAKYKSPIGFEAIHSLPSDQFELKLSSEFGNGKNNSIFWPGNTILSNDTCNSFKEFAKYLVLAVDQPNEKQLEPFIREEIGHLSNLESTALDIATNQLIKDITDWYKEDYVRYLNSQDGISYLNKVRQQITEIISRESVISTYSSYCNIMDDLNIKFQDTSSDGKLQSFLASDSSVSIIEDESECFILNSIKLYESMRRLKLAHYLFYATRLHASQSEDIGKLIDFFESSTLYNLLVLELDVDLSGTIDRLIKILAENKKKKMILVSKGQFSGISCFNQIIPVTVEAAPQYSFENFTHKCRNYLLEKSVDFQGTPSVLNDLIPLVDAGQIFKGKLLIQLIESKDFVISRNGESSIGYNKKTYINRFVVCREPIINSLDIDAIGVDSIANTEEEYHEKCRTQKNVHLLIPRKDGNYLWKQSQGNYSQLQKYLVVFRDEDREHLISSRTFIIADSAGTGKSTIFSHLTNHLKSGYPHNWIQYIDLNKYTAKFEKAIKEGRHLDENNLLHFLAVELMSLETELEMEVFKYYFGKGEKLFLFFDAFDEISPQYTKLVMKMFIILQRTPLKFLGITTRPHLRALLEEHFNTIMYTLQPFSPSDQIHFLKRQWMEENNLTASDIARVNKFANIIINQFSSKVNDENSNFFGVPFQTMMIADIYEEKVIENLKNEICNPQFETYDVIDLYEIFIRTKYVKQLKEKFEMDSSKPGFESMLKGLMEVNNKRHKEYALSTVFKDDIKLDWLADDKEVEEILRIGILTKQSDGLVFIHKTVAEYFVSQHLTEANNWTSGTIKTIISTVFIQPEFKVVRIFMNQLLKKKERNEMLEMAQSLVNQIRFNTFTKDTTRVSHARCTCLDGWDIRDPLENSPSASRARSHKSKQFNVYRGKRGKPEFRHHACFHEPKQCICPRGALVFHDEILDDTPGFRPYDRVSIDEKCFVGLIVNNYCHILRLLFSSFKFLPIVEVTELILLLIPIILQYEQAEIFDILIECIKSEEQRRPLFQTVIKNRLYDNLLKHFIVNCDYFASVSEKSEEILNSIIKLLDYCKDNSIINEREFQAIVFWDKFNGMFSYNFRVLRIYLDYVDTLDKTALNRLLEKKYSDLISIYKSNQLHIIRDIFQWAMERPNLSIDIKIESILFKAAGSNVMERIVEDGAINLIDPLLTIFRELLKIYHNDRSLILEADSASGNSIRRVLFDLFKYSSTCEMDKKILSWLMHHSISYDFFQSFLKYRPNDLTIMQYLGLWSKLETFREFFRLLSSKHDEYYSEKLNRRKSYTLEFLSQITGLSNSMVLEAFENLPYTFDTNLETFPLLMLNSLKNSKESDAFRTLVSQLDHYGFNILERAFKYPEATERIVSWIKEDQQLENSLLRINKNNFIHYTDMIECIRKNFNDSVREKFIFDNQEPLLSYAVSNNKPDVVEVISSRIIVIETDIGKKALERFFQLQPVPNGEMFLHLLIKYNQSLNLERILNIVKVFDPLIKFELFDKHIMWQGNLCHFAASRNNIKIVKTITNFMRNEFTPLDIRSLIKSKNTHNKTVIDVAAEVRDGSIKSMFESLIQ